MPPFRTDDYLAITSTLAARYDNTTPIAISVPGLGYGNLGVPDENDPEFTDIDQPREIFVYSPYTNFMYAFIDSYISERHTERVETTDYPVESGFIHSDHAVVYPTIVEITGMSSNFSKLGGGAESSRNLSPRSENAWATMREMMHNRTPMFLETRLYENYVTYNNMVITDLETTLDVQTGASLPYRIVFKQIRQQNVGFEYGTMIDPNRVPDTELVETLIRNNDDYTSIGENSKKIAQEFTDAFSHDKLKQAEISDAISKKLQGTLDDVVEGQGSLFNINVAKLEDEVGNYYRNATSRIDVFEVELRDKQNFSTISGLMLPISVNVGLPGSVERVQRQIQFDVEGNAVVVSAPGGQTTGRIVQNVRIDIYPEGTSNSIGIGTITGDLVNLNNITGFPHERSRKYPFMINKTWIDINIARGIGKPRVISDRVYIDLINGDQKFSINEVEFILSGDDITIIRELDELQEYTEQRIVDGKTQNIKVNAFQEKFHLKIAEAIERTINVHPNFNVTVNASRDDDDLVQFDIQNVGLIKVPKVSGTLFGNNPTSFGVTNIGDQIARVLQDGIRDKLNTPNATVNFVPPPSDSRIAALGFAEDVGANIGRFVVNGLGDKIPTIEYGEALFGTPTTSGFRYTITDLNAKEITITAGDRISSEPQRIKVSNTDSRSYQNAQPYVIATGKLETGVSLVGDPNKLLGDFSVSSNKNNPVEFLATEEVWNDWDLVFAPLEVFQPIYEDICEEFENR